MSKETPQNPLDDEFYSTLKTGLMAVFKASVKENNLDCHRFRDTTSGIAAAEAAKALIELEKLKLGIR